MALFLRKSSKGKGIGEFSQKEFGKNDKNCKIKRLYAKKAGNLKI